MQDLFDTWILRRKRNENFYPVQLSRATCMLPTMKYRSPEMMIMQRLVMLRAKLCKRQRPRLAIKFGR